GFDAVCMQTAIPALGSIVPSGKTATNPFSHRPPFMLLGIEPAAPREGRYGFDAVCMQTAIPAPGDGGLLTL
ncbi:MAG: hypothetical protein KDD70_18780, partial [Bdellovibrionales bacterium]|nr:hypothetical protein [Bdellovibrionales bacterium]